MWKECGKLVANRNEGGRNTAGALKIITVSNFMPSMCTSEKIFEFPILFISNSVRPVSAVNHMDAVMIFHIWQKELCVCDGLHVLSVCIYVAVSRWFTAMLTLTLLMC